MKHTTFLLVLSATILLNGCSRAKRTASEVADAAADSAKAATTKAGTIVSEVADAAIDTTKAATAKAGAIVGEHVSTFFSGVGEGVEKIRCDYETVFEGPEAEAAGMTVSLVRKEFGSGNDAPPDLSLYVLNEKPVSGTLRIRFLTSDGREIGRGSAELQRDADDAGYLRVPMPKDMPTELVTRLSLSIRPSPQ